MELTHVLLELLKEKQGHPETGLLERGHLWDERDILSASTAARRFNTELRVNTLIKRLSTAPAAYNRLTELWYRKPETVVYRVDLSSPTGPRLPTALEGEAVTIEIPVTPEMSVELVGSAGLDIEPMEKSKKRVSDAAPTSWEWKVTSIGTDDQFLILTTYAHNFWG